MSKGRQRWDVVFFLKWKETSPLLSATWCRSHDLIWGNSGHSRLTWVSQDLFWKSSTFEMRGSELKITLPYDRSSCLRILLGHLLGPSSHGEKLFRVV